MCSTHYTCEEQFIDIGSLLIDEERTVEKKAKERFFSIELNSKRHVKNVTLNDGPESVLIEGTIGQLHSAAFTDGLVLEVVGDKGVLRINLTQDEIKQKAGQEKERKLI